MLRSQSSPLLNFKSTLLLSSLRIHRDSEPTESVLRLSRRNSCLARAADVVNGFHHG